MRVIEAMKKVKAGKEKIGELHKRIGLASANLSNETAMYGDQTVAKIKEYIQSIHDTGKENIRLLTAISRTNMVTQVTITIGGVAVTKSLAEWVWRRREYAALDEMAYRVLTDRRLKPTSVANSQGQLVNISVVKHYDEADRDAKLDLYRNEPHAIDAALEVVNATTDLIEA